MDGSIRLSAQERNAAAFERLLHVGAASFDRYSDVWVVTIGAAHFAFQHRMMVRQLERRANFQVTLETGLRRLPRIDDRAAAAAAGFNVQTPGAVAIFAAHINGLFHSLAALCLSYDHLFFLQSRMCSCSKVADDFFMAGRAFF